MKKNVEISGALINGMLSAFRSAYALSDLNQFKFLEDFEDDKWYDFDIWDQLYQSIKKSNEHIDFSQILFKAGSDFISNWYLHAGGHEFIKNHQDFIALQTGSEGYEMVVRGGDKETRGFIDLVEYDEKKHFFHLKSTTLFPEFFTKGVFYKGINLCNDLDYIEINSKSEKVNGLYQVDLKVSYLPKNQAIDYDFLSDNIHFMDNKIPKKLPVQVDELYWIYRGIKDEFELNQKYNIQLQTLLKNRTDSLYNKTLELQNNLLLLEAKNVLIDKQKKELEQLTNAHNKLFKVLGHDLKSPIGSISGLSSIMLEKGGDLTAEEVKSFSKSIHLTSGKMLTLLHNLLDWARSQTNSLEIKREATDINQLLSENVSFFNASATSKQIELTFEPKTLPKVFCDRNTINTVIRNICSNAIKFTGFEGKVTIDAKPIESFIEISISDNGMGMDSNDLKNLFDDKTSFSRDGANGEKGTGLGLVLCKEFVELNSGKISAKSEIGTGTIFSFTVPVFLN